MTDDPWLTTLYIQQPEIKSHVISQHETVTLISTMYFPSINIRKLKLFTSQQIYQCVAKITIACFIPPGHPSMFRTRGSIIELSNVLLVCNNNLSVSKPSLKVPNSKILNSVRRVQIPNSNLQRMIVANVVVVGHCPTSESCQYVWFKFIFKIINRELLIANQFILMKIKQQFKF